jgi:hypothetical protein
MTIMDHPSAAAAAAEGRKKFSPERYQRYLEMMERMK